MCKKKKIVLTLLFILWLTPTIILGQAAGNSKLPTTYSFQLDQDKFVPGNEDRNYTMGIYFDFDSPCLDSVIVHRALRYTGTSIANKLYRTENGISFGNNQIGLYGGGFTPDSLGTQSIVKGDRPYSSLVGLNFGVNYHFKTAGRNKSESQKFYRNTTIQKWRYRSRYINLMGGMLGLSFQGKLQDYIHHFTPNYEDTIAYVNPVKPYGWGNQVSKGGGITGLIQVGGSRLITSEFLSRFIFAPTSKDGWTVGEKDKLNWFQRRFELKAGYQLMLGYYNNAQLNSEFRFGAIDPSRWIASWTSNGSSNNFTESQFLVLPETHPNKKNFEFFIFGGIRGNFMFYNTLLQGQLIDFLTLGHDSKYLLTGDEVNRTFISGNIGVAIRFKGFSVSYSAVSFRTAELKTEDRFIRTHQWGEIKVKISCQK